MRDANVIRSFRRLADAGILRCNAKLTDCRVGPRGRQLTDEGEAGILVVIGYLKIDDIVNLTQVDEHSAKSEVGLSFRPTPEYLKFHDEFRMARMVQGTDQSENDGTATVLFHRSAKGWAVEDILGLKKTATTAWKTSLQTDLPAGPSIVNVARFATVSVSSENKEAGQVAANAVDGTALADDVHEPVDWASRGDAGAWIRLDWPSQVEVWEVVLYDRPNMRDHILGGVLRFSDGSQVNVGALPNDGSPFRVEFDPRTITWMQFKVTTADGGSPGLQEIEVFGTKL